MMQRLLAILLICILLPPLARAGKEPGVYLESRTECLAEQGIDQRLGAVLERHGAAGHLSLTVADAPAASGGLLVAGFGYRDNYHRWQRDRAPPATDATARASGAGSSVSAGSRFAPATSWCANWVPASTPDATWAWAATTPCSP